MEKYFDRAFRQRGKMLRDMRGIGTEKRKVRAVY